MLSAPERFDTHCAPGALKEAMLYAQKRKTFGKFLIQHQASSGSRNVLSRFEPTHVFRIGQVIRHKIAEMAMRIESCHSNIEADQG